MGFHHPCGHRAVHFEIGGGHGFAVAVVGHDDLAHALPEVLQILGDGENGHDFGRHGDVKAGTHHEPVGAPVGAVHADDDVAQGLAAEIHDPAHVHIGGVDVQAGHPRQLEQLFIIIIPLMLHTGSQRHHGEVMGVHHRVDIAGKTQGILRQRDALGKPAAAAEPFTPIVGPPEGWRMAAEARLLRRPRPCTRPMVVVDLPSPRAWA